MRVLHTEPAFSYSCSLALSLSCWAPGISVRPRILL